MFLSMWACMQFFPSVITVMPAQNSAYRYLQEIFPAFNGEFQPWLIIYSASTALIIAFMLQMFNAIVGAWTAAAFAISVSLYYFLMLPGLTSALGGMPNDQVKRNIEKS